MDKKILKIESNLEMLCPIKYFLEVAGGKWKSSIICILSDGKYHRNAEIKRRLNGITNAMLTQCLRQLKNDDIIERVQYNEIPPRVEYRLTKKGNEIIPILESMAVWGFENLSGDTGKRVYCRTCRSIV